MQTPQPIPETQLTPVLQQPIAGALAPSPYSFEFSGEDNLRLTVHNAVSGVVVSVHYRMHRAGAPTHASAFQYAPSADRVASAVDFSLGEGYLLNVTCFCSAGSPKIGQTFVKLEVIRGRTGARTVLGTILQDYVTAQQPIAWPGSPLRSSTEGRGAMREVSGTQPGAGLPIMETVPTGARWEFVSFRAQLVTSATAGLRRMLLFGYGATAAVLALHATGDINASTVGTMEFGQSYPYTLVAGTNQFLAPFPIGFTLAAANYLYLTCNGMKADDQYSAPTYVVREWLEAQ